MGQKQSMEDQLIDLKLNAKTLERAYKKCEASKKKNEAKIKQCVQRGDMESAQIYAENAIRERKQGIQYLTLASRLDAVAGKLQSAVRAQQASVDLGHASKTMAKAMESMNVEKMSAVMSDFEEKMEQLDVVTSGMNSSLDTATASQMPEEQVEELIRRVADENSLEVDQLLEQAGSVGTSISTGTVANQPVRTQANEEPTALAAGN